MPQFDVSHFASQIVWLAATFAVLYSVMARLTLPRIRDVLAERRERIASDLEKAELAKQDAEAAQADYTSALENSRIQAKKLLTETEDQIKREAQERSNQLDETLHQQIREAELLFRKTRQDAVEKITPVSLELAAQIFEKIVGKKADIDHLQQAMDQIKKNRTMPLAEQGHNIGEHLTARIN